MSPPPDSLTPDHIVLDALPEAVVAAMEVRDRWATGLQYDGGLEFLVADLSSWTPGQTVRVAFLGGDDALYEQIEAATQEISDAANLTLSFRDAGGAFRTWTEADTDLAAEIRVSFDQDGFFSLVGTDSVDASIDGGPVGGAPHQRSLNLEGFDVQLPDDWEGTVRHEFLHALAFHHEHQNMRGPCESAFRWEDDPGYVPTRDAAGRFVTDAGGRRPGIYTFLAGPPNSWSKAKVDHNLRTEADSPAVAGPFDAASVMLYRFPALFYRSQPSPCAPTGDGQHLSDGDVRALQLLYPAQQEAVTTIADRREALAGLIEGSGGDGGLESAVALPEIAANAAGRLRASVAAMRA